MTINLAEVESANAIMTDKGVFAVGPHPADRLQRPLILLYLDAAKAQSVAAHSEEKHGNRHQVVYIAEINALRKFVGALGDDVIVVLVEGNEQLTDQVERTPRDLLAALPAGDFYGFTYERTGAERFEPGAINITPGVYEVFGAQAGGIVQQLLARHLSGDYGDDPGLKQSQGPGLKSDWEYNDERVAASSEPYVLSVYPNAGGSSFAVTVWVLSQYGYTTVLVPTEY